MPESCDPTSAVTSAFTGPVAEMLRSTVLKPAGRVSKTGTAATPRWIQSHQPTPSATVAATRTSPVNARLLAGRLARKKCPGFATRQVDILRGSRVQTKLALGGAWSIKCQDHQEAGVTSHRPGIAPGAADGRPCHRNGWSRTQGIHSPRRQSSDLVNPTGAIEERARSSCADFPYGTG